MRLRRLFTTLVALAVLAFPAGAAADDFQQIFGDYKSDGRIDNCYRPDQLHNAGQSIPPDIEQYAPGFGDALSSAQSQCGSGGRQTAEEPEEDKEPALVSAGGASGPDIKKKKAVTEPPAPEVVPTAASTALAAPELPAAAAVSNDTPGALVALLIAAGIAVVLALAWTIAWFMGWSPERLTKPVFAAFQSVWDRVLPGR